ncbi:Type IV pilus biogenesis protein PilQ [hydrothermal vent metagenome]|uniref:Type IV pilus biogenesis protein PilQ n=1 Tax=hydrothermal vent metagenome TaxID=652676 RepID=A0A3B1DC43_9ZZZZ
MIRQLRRLFQRFHFPRFVPFVMVSVLLGFISSCGLQRQGESLELPPAVMVQDIRVSEGTEKTIVEVEGGEPMIYTTFRLSDPERLVIDMAEVDLSRFPNEIQLENGPIRAIRPGSGGGSNVSRLEFELFGVVETDVRTEGLNLIVEVTQVVAAPRGFRFFEEEAPVLVLDPADSKGIMPDVNLPVDAPAELAVVPVLPDADLSDLPDIAVEVKKEGLNAKAGEEKVPGVSDDPLSPLQEMDTPPGAENPENKENMSLVSLGASSVSEETVPLPAAQKISGLRFETGEKLKLIVSSDGTLSPRTFFIGFGDKRRLVIDLPGVKIFSKQTRVTVDDHRVKQLRVGQHKKKLRLVLDLLSPISYHLTQRRGDLVILIEGPSKKDVSDEVNESVSSAVVQVNGPPSEVLSEAPTLQKSEPVRSSSDLVGIEGVESGESGLVLKSMPFAIPLPSPRIAAAATLPLPLPVPNAEEKSDVVSDELVQTEDTLQVQEMPQVEALSEAPPLEEMPEAQAAAPSESVQKMDEGDLVSEKMTSELAVPVKAELRLSSPEPGEPLPLLDVPEGNEVSEEKTVSEDKKTKLEREKAAKKKVILRRKRREAVLNKRDKIARENAAKIESAALAIPEKYTGRKISLDFQEAEITNVVRLIADVSGLNFVMGDDVKGKITVKLNDVPWDQALEIILEIRNLGMERQGDIIRIATLSNLTKQRNEKAEARATKIRAEELLTRVIYINYAEANKLQSLLSKLLSTRGEIMLAKRVNALVVKDILGNLDQVEQMVQRLDTKTPQVLIEARIVEVQPTFKRSLGVQWGADFKTNSGGNSIGIGTFTGPGSSVFNPVPDFAVDTPASTALGGVGFSFGRFTESPFQLDLRISAGESQEMTRIVSTPKIMVLDNHEALIKQGAKIPFQTSSPNGGTNTRLVDANLELKVTPHISQDGGILLELNLTKNQPGPPIQGATQPSIFQKEVSTQILLMDGETMVIGGIYETQKTESEGGIPFLKDIPGLGWLFKNKEQSETTTELLIFITPTVMK